FDWANTGSTTISQGTIKLGNSAAGLGNSSTLTIANGATWDMNNITDIIGSLAGAGAIVNGNNLTLSGNNGATTVYSGSYSGAGKLVKNGSGAQTLSGSNGFTSLDFNGGRINFNNNGAAGAGVINVANASGMEFVSTAVGTTLPNDIVLAGGANVVKLYATTG